MGGLREKLESAFNSVAPEATQDTTQYRFGEMIGRRRGCDIGARIAIELLLKEAEKLSRIEDCYNHGPERVLHLSDLKRIAGELVGRGEG